jgi:hypothetical protein
MSEANLSLAPDFLARLMVMTRGVRAKEAEVDPDSGCNPVDDQMHDVLQDSPDDLTKEWMRPCGSPGNSRTGRRRVIS